MNDSVHQIQKHVKRGLAGVLFTLLLVGACGAALSVLAAGMNALSETSDSGSKPGVYTASPATQAVASSSGNASQTASQTASAQGATTQDGLSTQSQSSTTTMPSTNPATTTATSSITFATTNANGLDNAIDTMQSPLEHSLDSGGVALGAKVQDSFGHLLSSVLQVLFLESSDNAAQQTGTTSTIGQGR